MLTVEALIKELLDYPMRAEVCIDTPTKMVWVNGTQWYTGYTGNAVELTLTQPVTEAEDRAND